MVCNEVTVICAYATYQIFLICIWVFVELNDAKTIANIITWNIDRSDSQIQVVLFM